MSISSSNEVKLKPISVQEAAGPRSNAYLRALGKSATASKWLRVRATPTTSAASVRTRRRAYLAAKSKLST